MTPRRLVPSFYCRDEDKFSYISFSLASVVGISCTPVCIFLRNSCKDFHIIHFPVLLIIGCSHFEKRVKYLLFSSENIYINGISVRKTNHQ